MIARLSFIRNGLNKEKAISKTGMSSLVSSFSGNRIWLKTSLWKIVAPFLTGILFLRYCSTNSFFWKKKICF